MPTTRRGRCSSTSRERRWSDEVLDALEIPEEWLPPVLESPDVGHGRRRPWRRAPATRRRPRSVSASTGPGRCSVVLGTSGVVFAALPRYAADAEARVHVFCHAVPGTWHAMGVMLSAAGSLQWLRARSRRRAVRRARRRGGALGARRRGAALPAVPRRRADAARRPGRTRRLRRASQLRHDRGALVRAVLEGVAYGLRDSLELLRALGVERRARARLRRWGALGVVARDRRLGARGPARADRSRRGRRVRRRAARRRGGRDLRRRARGGRGAAADRERDRARPRLERVYAELHPRYRALYPAMRTLDDATVES